jgi:hypothetical protein
LNQGSDSEFGLEGRLDQDIRDTRIYITLLKPFQGRERTFT